MSPAQLEKDIKERCEPVMPFSDDRYWTDPYRKEQKTTAHTFDVYAHSMNCGKYIIQSKESGNVSFFCTVFVH
jgi:hypothetical protein